MLERDARVVSGEEMHVNSPFWLWSCKLRPKAKHEK